MEVTPLFWQENKLKRLICVKLVESLGAEKKLFHDFGVNDILSFIIDFYV